MDKFVIAGREFGARLIVGTGKYKTMEAMEDAFARSGAEMITVAVRRVNLTDRSQPSLLDHIDLKKYAILPNTAGCYTAEEAIRTARLAREVGLSDWVKVEVIGDQKTLFPDNEATLVATRTLVNEGFTVLPYFSDDLIMGIQNPANLRIMREMITEVPIIVDAGVGTASDACFAMELGIDGILMNTAIAEAKDPGAMAEAMRLAVTAGRLAYQAGRMPQRLYASASSPLEGISR
jgi:thiazole synthase